MLICNMAAALHVVEHDVRLTLHWLEINHITDKDDFKT